MEDGLPDQPLFRGLLLAGFGFAFSCLAALTGFLATRVWDDHTQIAQQDTVIHQLSDIAVRIDRHLESIDSKYQDSAIAIQTLKGNQDNNIQAMTRFKEEMESNRADRLRAVDEINKRLSDMERLIAPLQGRPYR